MFAVVEGPNSELNLTGANVSFRIDGTLTSTRYFPIQTSNRLHVPAFESHNIPSSISAPSPNMHTLEVEILSSASGNQSTFMVDYLIYEATTNSTISVGDGGKSWVFVDDRSPYIVYQDGSGASSSGTDGMAVGWIPTVPGFTSTKSFNITDLAFNSTLMGPTNASSVVSLNFTGEGSVYISDLSH